MNLKRLNRKDLFKRFSEIMAIFESAKELAYNKLFRTDILTYSASGFRLNKDEIGKFQREYVKLVFQCCGPNISSDLEEIHGDLESLSISLVNDFISRVEQDESTITEAIKNQEESKLEQDEEQ